MDSVTHQQAACRTQRIYQLGDLVFTLRNCDPKYEEALETLLPRFDGVTPPNNLDDVNTGCSKDVMEIVRYTASSHHKRQCIWLEADCLITSSGHKILIAGLPRSGKSTTTMALAKRHGWRIFSQNFTIIDHSNGRLLKFLAPLCLSNESVEILEQLSVLPEPRLNLEWRKNRVWSPVPDLIGDTIYGANFELIIWLERGEQFDSQFSAKVLNKSDVARKMLPISNILKLPGAYEAFLNSVADSDSLNLAGGEVEQRLNEITAAVVKIERS